MIRSKITTLLLIVIVIAFFRAHALSAQDQKNANVHQEIKSKSFNLVDAKGRVCAKLWNGASGTSPQLTFFSTSGVPTYVIEGKTSAVKQHANPSALYRATMVDSTINRIIGKGRWVILDDGSWWEVGSGEESQVVSWGRVEVVITDPKKFGEFYFYDLYNSEDKESVSVTFKGYR